MHFRHEGSDRLSTIELAEAALNSQLDTFFVFEPDSGKAVYWNKAFRDTSGYTDEEIAGLPAPVSYYDSDTLQRIKNCMQENSTTGVLDIDAHFICKDGSRIHTEYRASYITDDENKPKYIVSIGRDITERKQTEEEPGMGETFSDSLVNTAQVIILVLNPDATIRFINPYMENLSGYTLAEVKGRDWFNTFLPDGDWSEIREVLRKTISDLNTIVHINPIITKDGRERFIEWHNQALRDRKSQVVGVLATGQNITERRDVEIKLKQSEERNNFAQAVGHVGTWDWNVITDEVIWSDETYRILGFFPGECMPSIELFMNLVHIDDRERISHAIESALNHNQAYNVDCRIIRKDGSECIANAQGEVLLNQDARPLQMRGTFQDISARKHLEEQLAQSQKMEAIGTLVGGIAHDFNNMLAGMTGNLYLAKEHVSEMPDVVDHLDHIEDIAFRAADMIQQLLTFARKSMVNIKPMPLNPYINETIKLLRTSVPENIELHQEVCSDALQINGDTTQLHQVLLNLVINARDAVEEVDHPVISIKLESFQPDGAFIASHASFKDLLYAHLSVEDNGCGIPEQQL